MNHKVKQNLKNKFIEKESNINWHYREFRMVEAEHWDLCEKSFGEDCRKLSMTVGVLALRDRVGKIFVREWILINGQSR